MNFCKKAGGIAGPYITTWKDRRPNHESRHQKHLKAKFKKSNTSTRELRKTGYIVNRKTGGIAALFNTTRNGSRLDDGKSHQKHLKAIFNMLKRSARYHT